MADLLYGPGTENNHNENTTNDAKFEIWREKLSLQWGERATPGHNTGILNDVNQMRIELVVTIPTPKMPSQQERDFNNS